MLFIYVYNHIHSTSRQVKINRTQNDQCQYYNQSTNVGLQKWDYAETSI